MLCVVLLGGLLCFGQDFFGRFPLVTMCGRFWAGHLDSEERRQSSSEVRLLDKRGSDAEMDRYLTEDLIDCFYTE